MTGEPPPRRHDSRSGQRSAASGWRFLVLVMIANMTELRRRVGRRRSETVVDEVKHRLEAMLSVAGIRTIDRTTIEIEADGTAHRQLDEMLRAIRLACVPTFDVDGEQLVIDVDIGAGAALAHGYSEIKLVEEAEAALAKARRVHRTVSSRLDKPYREEGTLAQELHSAIQGDQFLLQYQPKVHVRRHEITSVEALVRWCHPTRGMILPSEFIGIAESARIIDEITLWVIRRAIDDQRALSQQGHDLRIFINVSGQLLTDASFVRSVCELVGVSDAKLGFEVTETSVIKNSGTAIANLQVFADIGIVIAIDDYGSGLSSLSYLKQLPASELKIDKMFVTQLTSSHRDPLIVRSTIDLAHALDMDVVAEGVESYSALALLTVMGCDLVQGFLISRPVDLNALVKFLDEDRNKFTAEETRASFNKLASVWKRS